MSLLNSTLVRDAQPGVYDVTVRYYKECAPANRQPYILVTMLIDGLLVDDRWYANRIPYIMRSLRRQYRMDYFDCTLSQLLEHARTHEFRIVLDYDPRYGRQIDYSVD